MTAFAVTGEVITCAFPEPGIGVTIEIPPDAMTWADRTVRVKAGASCRVPVNDLTFTNKTPRISSGVKVNVAKDTISWGDVSPRATAGARAVVPKDTLTEADKAPRITAGAWIPIAVTVDMRLQFGVTGEDITSEYITLDGALSTRPALLPDRLISFFSNVVIRSGASRRIPPDFITITERPFELGARRRKIKVYAVTS